MYRNTAHQFNGTDDADKQYMKNMRDQIDAKTEELTAADERMRENLNKAEAAGGGLSEEAKKALEKE